MRKIILLSAILIILSGCSSDKTLLREIPEAKAETICSCEKDSYNCKDFKSRREANEIYECCLKKVGYDVHRLDRDSDGIACEW